MVEAGGSVSRQVHACLTTLASCLRVDRRGADENSGRGMIVFTGNGLDIAGYTYKPRGRIDQVDRSA